MDDHQANRTGQGPALRETLRYLFLSEKDSAYIYLILAVITLIGLSLRALDLNQPIAYDEAYTFIHFASRSFKHILADYSAPNNHIFHTVLVGIAYRLFGAEPWVLRLPAFLAGVLLAPVMFVAARRFFSAPQALAAAGLIAVVPLFIDYSVDGRGYTLLVLFALLLTNFAAILVKQPRRPALAAYAITGALGFYTIPIFLYPMAGVSLWVVMTYLFSGESWQINYRRLLTFIGVCLLSGVLTLILYSPVILFGTGLASLTSNEFVQPLDWSGFLANLDPRMVRAWNKWMIGLSPTLEYLLLGGFFISLLFFRRVSNQKVPLQLSLALAVIILLVVQRVTPLPRMWIYLEAFYLMFAAAGLVWLAQILLRVIFGRPALEKVLAFTIMSIFIGVLVNTMIARQLNPALANRDRLPEEYAAEYLVDHLSPQDTIVATSPADIQTAYYLGLQGIPYDRFYQRDHPVDIQNALVILRRNSKYKTPESVAGFFKLEESLDLAAAQLVFEYANVEIYSVPAK